MPRHGRILQSTIIVSIEIFDKILADLYFNSTEYDYISMEEA